jgi:hypothetical protein
MVLRRRYTIHPGKRSVIVGATLGLVPLFITRAIPADQEVRGGEENASVQFSLEWAMALRGIATFEALQRAAGAAGIVTKQVEAGGNSYRNFHWIGLNGLGEMTVTRYQNGDFRAVITTNDQRQLTLNNSGGFACPTCVPPINACGHRPSWIARDLHWDNWDCEHPANP